MKRKEMGFTLLELIVLTIIIAVLAAILFPNLTKAVQKRNVNYVLSTADNFRKEINLYYKYHGYYPIDIEENSSNGTWSSDFGVDAEWPWDKSRTMKEAANIIIVPGENDHEQRIYIYWAIPKPAKTVAETMTQTPCPDPITDRPAVVIDLTSGEPAYICK
jgi:type II secretory pathway pseudopilin PulG